MIIMLTGGGGFSRRVLQITELVRECLQQRDANCTILPAPPETCDLDSTATILQRCACKDATSASPLRKILSNKRKGSSSSSSLEVSSETDEFGCPENVQVGCCSLFSTNKFSKEDRSCSCACPGICRRAVTVPSQMGWRLRR